ncbi:MAG: hypothetical protein OMM_09114 [Candidatus Magnetoglobus multicellularis str. Araruama]|uniref:Uncharacterized protein n=1 Tax=Candidatus Magnetoglobus multicellularis str. Araruama TaxID=890399 RepID=A0A1V1P5E7_9BACT|nr:MAG: hypothetical protein OMM_09114 [Candidatus Magnetoglobus multicellularis str. Araruama]
MARIDALIHWQEHQVVLQKKAFDIFAHQTIPALKQVQDLLGRVRREARQNIMTDESMLEAAEHAKTITIIALIVSQSANECNSSSMELNSSSTELSTLAEKLKNLIGQFKY